MKELSESKEVAFTLISKAGEGRSYAFEALEKAKDKDFEGAQESIEKAEKLLNEAHQSQFEIISKETAGTSNIELSFLMVHAQDHLMTAILAKELLNEIIENIKEIHTLKGCK